MSTPLIPSVEQLNQTRARLWHQDGSPLLTMEALRAWIGKAGLVLFAPKQQQLPGPSASLVEAVLGTRNEAPTLEEGAEAAVLLGRLIAEGSAVPLNLLGAAGERPDFVCSPAVFSYVFTLRGDKAWKQAPATIGAVKVSPLALAAYEALARRVTLSASELVDELGKEVTETAVIRALSELWAHLRVMPVPRPDGEATLWELTSTRFTKQIKAGANAGQPTALSALVSLFLGQAVVATEEEIETILSPLAPRSRIRDVVHALMGARELGTMAIDGRTVVFIEGDLAEMVPEAKSVEPAAAEGDEGVAAEGEARITKFIAKPRKVGTGFAKSFKPRPEGGRAGGGRPPGGGFQGGRAEGGRSEGSRFEGSRSGGGERERRPFAGKSVRPAASFSKPWEEGKPRQASVDAAGEGGPAGSAASERPAFDKSRRPAFGDRPAFGKKPGFARPGGFSRPGASARPEGGPRRPYGGDGPARPGGSGFPARTSDGDARPPRKTFSKPGTFGRKREDADRPRSFQPRSSQPFQPREDSQGRPPGKFSGSGNSGRPNQTGGAERRPFRPRTDAAGSGGAGERGGSRGAGQGFERRPGSYSARPQRPDGGYAAKRPFAASGDDRAAGKRPFTPRGERPTAGGSFAKGPGDGEKPRTFRKFDAPKFGRPGASAGDRGGRPAGGGRAPGGSGPGGGFAGRKPAGPFAKFADGKKPFRGAGASGKPGGGKSGGPRREGTGFVKRKPDEGETA